MIKKVSIFVDKHPFYILGGIILLGIILRLVNLEDNIIFWYDQARDAQRIIGITKGNFKIVGPETDIPGIFNGPLFYYLLLPFYWISHFNPNLPALFVIIINTFMIALSYYAVKLLFNNTKVALLSSLLWSISYLQLNYARYISNASFMTIASTIFFIGLALYVIKDKKNGLTISVLGYATAIHFNFYLVYLGMFYPLFLLIYKKRITVKQAFLHILLCFVLLSPFLLAELKWRFMMSRSLLNYFFNQSKDYSTHVFFFITISDNILRYVNKLAETIHESVFKWNTLSGLLLFGSSIFLVIKKERKRKEVIFLLIWLLSTTPLFLFKSGVLNVSVINTTIFVPITIVFAFLLYYISQINVLLYIIGLVVVIASNFILWKQSGFIAVKHFVDDPMLYGNEKRLIDYTYHAAKNKSFTICSVSVPLFINTNWSFLYETYGKEKYGFVPTWSGQIQTQNETFLPYDKNHEKQRFLIVEPKKGMPVTALKTTIYLEDQISSLQEEKKFGGMVVQNRLLTKDTSQLKDTQRLTTNDIKMVNYITSIEARYHCSIEY